MTDKYILFKSDIRKICLSFRENGDLHLFFASLP